MESFLGVRYLARINCTDVAIRDKQVKSHASQLIKSMKKDKK